MSDSPTLGFIPSVAAPRDAVHIAVIAVVAGEELSPGAKVRMASGKAVAATDAAIGVVDPFRRGQIAANERVWMLLFPNTIVGLRHQWWHPEFPITDGQGHPEVFLRVALGCGKTVEALLDDATSFATSYGEWPDYIMDNSERYKNVDSEDWKAFWIEFERVTGRKPFKDYGDSSPYTCSC